MKQAIAKLIDEFLEEKRESFGGYAEVTDNDVRVLEKIISKLISEKFERDPDGDLPIKYLVVDKTKYRFPAYTPVIHYRRIGSEELSENDKRNLLRDLNMNLQIATDELDIFIRIETDVR